MPRSKRKSPEVNGEKAVPIWSTPDDRDRLKKVAVANKMTMWGVLRAFLLQNEKTPEMIDFDYWKSKYPNPGQLAKIRWKEMEDRVYQELVAQKAGSTMPALLKRLNRDLGEDVEALPSVSEPQLNRVLQNFLRAGKTQQKGEKYLPLTVP